MAECARTQLIQICMKLGILLQRDYCFVQMSKRGTKKAEESGWAWEAFKTCFVGQSKHEVRDKIAGFDMDSTLIEPKSGAKFPKDANDWKWWNPVVPKKMKELYDEGYRLVIFTNQKGISTGNTTAEAIKKKIETISAEMGVEMMAIMATEDDEFRKPGTKMWDLFLQYNDNKADLTKSFYCGDAAGRKTGGHKDFSDGDLKFALNVGVEFKTPENLFLGDKTIIKPEGFNPKSIPEDGKLFANSNDKDVKFVEKQMVIFCGSPGSGKSTFSHNYMPLYERVNRDTLKTKQKCYKVAEEHIKNGKSVIIDNTNPKVEDRKYFLDLAKKHGYKARCFYFLTNKEVCFHNDFQRIGNDKRAHFSGKAGKIPIHSWFKYVEKPTLAEGFYEIKEVNFVPKFNDDPDRKAYHCFSGKV